MAEAVGLYNRGQYSAAVERFLAAVRLDPTEAEFHNMLGCAAERADMPQLVERHLHEAIRLNPRHAGAHAALGAWHADRGELEPALRHSTAALEIKPGDPKALLALASTHFARGDKQATFEALRPMIEQPVPNRWAVQLYARLAPGIGHEEQALAAIDRALTAPNLPPTPDGKPLLLFAAAALLERLGRYAEAFARAREGNEVARTSRPPFDPVAHASRVNRSIRYFSKRRVQSLPRATHGNGRPVFIVGMPRSGTSLVEQVLASHPAVYGAGELRTLGLIARETEQTDWAKGEPYPHCLDMLSPRRANELAARYLSVIESMNVAARYVTDKMPVNFLHLDLVELLFPESRIIHCVRSPLDTCLSCYTSNFARGNEFSFDLSHLGPYYRDYQRLMDHWAKVLTVPMLEVRYEDVVLDTEQQVRRMLEFLDLPWDERCLKFYENRRNVQTSSKDQVNKPIYISSVARWKFYEKHVGPLIASLGTPAASRAEPQRQAC
jgi:tetratricopeptide (TPR) repeat protein